MKIICFNNLSNFTTIKNIDKNKRSIKLYSFKNIQFTGLSEKYPDILFKQDTKDYLILPINEMTMSLNKKSYYEENGMIFEYKNNYKNLIEDNVYFFIYNTENYYHFIYDTLPYLYCFFYLKKQIPTLKLLVNYNKGKNYFLPFVKEALELLDINDKDIIFHKNGNKYKNIYISNSLTHDGLSNNPPRNEIFEIYDMMIKNANKNIINPFTIKKIYISRRTWINKNTDNIGTDYTLRRKLMNEDELMENLKKYDFVEIFGENYSFRDKILLFNQADIVIGAIGGTITNCIFCNKNSKIISIVSPYFLNSNSRMKYLFNNNVILFNDTKLYNYDEIPHNTRIEITNKKSLYYKKIGEIEKKDSDKFIIKLGNNYIGWNKDEKYNKIKLGKEQFKILDYGLNSPWLVNIKKLLCLI